MTNDKKPQLPVWAFMTGGVAVALTFIGIINGSDASGFNSWLVAGCGVGGAGMIALIIWSKTKDKKG